MALEPVNQFVIYYDGDNLTLPEDEALIDLGERTQGGVWQWSILIENQSDQTLLISNIRGSCGFQVPAWPRAPVAAGQSGVIQLRYDASRPGKFSRNITINANTHNSVTVIPVRGHVIKK